eukprot:TRINITY_DN4289_c0_g1_i1.p1 TRINITY_DN4289_c0_g1~~TRINITY_DN4289_c0_g1_i1.p1  ORF type:complete len:811 (-),score=350.70 TRINITY_DN4289_c0_g1_i1:1092-3524(-)
MNIAPGVTASRVGSSDPLRGGGGGLPVGGGLSNRRPGQVPPFAVFSQEKRGRLQELHPEYNYGELGRRLSEMWHALSEEDKELYRRKARLIGVQKLKAWDDKMKRSGNPYYMQQQQQPMGHAQKGRPTLATSQQAAAMQGNSIKRRRTHGYAIFMSEERKKHSTLNVPLGDVTRKVAEAWRSLDPSVRATYEAKANRINAIENKRYQQALLAHHRSNGMKQIPGGAGQQPFRIASVESLSRPKPNVSLPSGITISRVEPDKNNHHLAPAPPQAHHHLQQQQHGRSSRGNNGAKSGGLIDMRVNNTTGMSGGDMIDMRGGRGGGGAPRYPLPPLQRRPQLHNNNGGGGIVPSGYALPGTAGMPMKRGLPPPPQGRHHLAAKRPKHHIIPPRPPLMRQGGPLMHSPSSMGILGTIDTWEKMCRLCGRTLIPILPIGEDPLILDKIREHLGLVIDPEADKDAGYPPGLCRKCSGMLNGFDRFKKVVAQGQGHLDELAKVKTSSSRRRGESRGGDAGSILPDLDIQIEEDNNVPRPMLPRPKRDEEGSVSGGSSMNEEEDDIDPDFDPLNFLQVSDVVGDYEDEERSPKEGENNGGGEEEDEEGEEDKRAAQDDEEECAEEDAETTDGENTVKSTDDIQIANAIYESLMDQGGSPTGSSSSLNNDEEHENGKEDGSQDDGEMNGHMMVNGGGDDDKDEGSPIINQEDDDSPESHESPQGSPKGEEEGLDEENGEEEVVIEEGLPEEGEELDEDPFPEPPTQVQEEESSTAEEGGEEEALEAQQPVMMTDDGEETHSTDDLLHHEEMVDDEPITQ